MLTIDPDIRRAETPPGSFYVDPAVFHAVTERFLAPGFHVVARSDELPPRRCVPFTLLPGVLDEPLVLTRDDAGALHALSNACTHRANLVVDAPCTQPTMRCRYHGRRFLLDGRMTHMPEFEEAIEFPRPADDLPRVAHAAWGPLIFVSLRGRSLDLRALDRLASLPLERAMFTEGRDYDVPANWALYVDNYLEGFHIPFVHPSLSKVLDYGSYDTECFDGGVLQLGIAREGEPTFEGTNVSAYYFWLAPTTMINVYPWGLSVNVVEPRAIDRTRVRFWSFVWDEAKREQGAGAGLHQVELEDEQVVESVQRGVRARLYQRGRYSPTRERGVHHFHRMLAAALT